MRGHVNCLMVSCNCHILSTKFLLYTSGLKTYFFSNSQSFASGFNLNLQFAVSNSQLVFAIISEIDSFNHLFLRSMKSQCANTWYDSESVFQGAWFCFPLPFTKTPLRQRSDLVLAEVSNSQLFSSAYIFNLQNRNSARKMRVCERKFQALYLSICKLHCLHHFPYYEYWLICQFVRLVS